MSGSIGSGILQTCRTGLQESFGLDEAQTTGTTRDQNNFVRKVELGQTLRRSKESWGLLSAFQVHVLFLWWLRGAAGLRGKTLFVKLAWVGGLETLIAGVCRRTEGPLALQVAATSQTTDLELAGEARGDVELARGSGARDGVGETGRCPNAPKCDGHPERNESKKASTNT